VGTLIHRPPPMSSLIPRLTHASTQKILLYQPPSPVLSRLRGKENGLKKKMRKGGGDARRRRK